MDANQLQELATNARLDHWPPHLGARTEAEKVGYLAQQVEAMADVMANNEDLLDENTAMHEEMAGLENKLNDRDDQIERLETKVDELTDENERLRGELEAKEPNV